MNDDISKAVTDRTLITFVYDGIRRLVEPHAYGVHKDPQYEILVGFQLGGSQLPGDLAGWKVYRVSEITDLRYTQSPFVRQPRNPDFLASQVSQTYAQAWTQTRAKSAA